MALTAALPTNDNVSFSVFNGKFSTLLLNLLHKILANKYKMENKISVWSHVQIFSLKKKNKKIKVVSSKTRMHSLTQNY